jgi:2,4-dienoyl-CoA reductase-like NADH-dependent reductase (Old Yellow Enzyme family)
MQDEIRPQISKTILCVTGGFRTAEKCAEAINNNTCDLVGMCVAPFAQFPPR